VVFRPAARALALAAAVAREFRRLAVCCDLCRLRLCLSTQLVSHSHFGIFQFSGGFGFLSERDKSSEARSTETNSFAGLSSPSVTRRYSRGISDSSNADRRSLNLSGRILQASVVAVQDFRLGLMGSIRISDFGEGLRDVDPR
jgi:hypothetical protein